MDDQDSNQPSSSSSGGSNGHSNQQNPFRVRRPSASIISTTTSMFQAPQNPNVQHQLQRPPSRQRLNNNNAIQQNFGSGDIDDDVVPQASSSSLRGRLSAGANSCSNGNVNNNNNRPSSPLGSPDSTAYWGPTPSPAPQHNYRAPMTPGGICIVSSSTSDDIPQSPFSPEEGGNNNHGFPHPPSPAVLQESRSPAPTNNSSGDEYGMGMQLLRRRPSLTNPSTLNLSNRGLASGHLQQDSNGIGNQDLNQNLQNNSNSNTNNVGNSPSFNISPLRNKIKKASSFERFSLAQAAIISNSSSGNNSAAGTSQSQNTGNNETSTISSSPPVTATSNSSIVGTNYTTSGNTSVNISVSAATCAGPSSSRAIWDPSPNQPANDTACASTSSSALRAFSTHGHGDKFHIKIPSKKLAAKIASVYEQEKLNEQLTNAAATLAAAEAISAVGAASKRLGLSPSVISSVTSATSTMSQNDGLLISQAGQSNNSSSSSSNPPSTLAQILNQSSNVHVNSIMTDDGIMNQDVNHENLIRELSEGPLNLTDTTTSTNTSSTQGLLPQRNPVISSRLSSHKKIPLTPKQKLLQRLQTGELMSSLSPSTQNQPIVTISQQVIQQSLPVQSIQQQSISSPVVTLHQSLSMNSSDALQSGITHVPIGNHSPPNQQQQAQLDPYNYDFAVQDSLGKVVVGDDPNNVSNMLSVYDNGDAYSYYTYQNILGDSDLFAGGNNPSSIPSSRQLLMMPSGNIPDGMEQPQGPLEFVLGFSGSVDDGDQRGRDDELQLNNIDPNDALSVMKSQNQPTTDSTLRSLLTMDSLRNCHPSAVSSADDSWLAIAANEYQNRINADSISLSRGGGLRTTGSSLGGNTSSGVSGSNSMSNSWVNQWPRSSAWQSHPAISSINNTGLGVQDQDEVMDMSMMDRPMLLSNQMKRLQLQMQQAANNNSEHSVDEMDLTNGLPILSQMPNMPLDLQQQMSMLPHGSSSGNTSGKDTLPMDLQQHHRMEIEDEPVNLMAVNMDQDQDLVHHHHHTSSHSSHSGHLSQAHSSHQQQPMEHNVKGIPHSQHNGNSYVLQIQGHHSPEIPQNLSDHSMNSNHSSNGSVPDNIDERRIIRAKKNKDIVMNSLNDQPYSAAMDDQEHINIIMDKPVQPKSIASLPMPFRLARVSSTEVGVLNNTNKSIAMNCRLGPVEGPLKKAGDDIGNPNASYPSLVMSDGSNGMWQLDRSDDEFCNWMKFVRLAHSIKDQNALIVENEGYLYFITCKEISPSTELQVGYSLEYAQKYGLPYLLPMEALMDHERMIKDSTLTINHRPPTSVSVVPAPVSPALSPAPMNQEGPNSERQPQEKNMTIEIYSCFECDQEFNLAEDLQAHLNTHKDTEPIRKPKKKAMKKFQIADLDSKSASTSAVPSISNGILSQRLKEPSQTMKADSSTVMESSNSNQEPIIQQQPQPRPGGDNSKQQDNSVTTGVGQPAAPPKVKCSMCYKAFATKERLEKHMIAHSDDETKPLKCNFCPKRFLTNSALAGHTKTHAAEGKNFECPMCNFSTPQLLQLKEHVQTHRNKDNGMFYCPRCSKKFSAYSMIRKHIRAFHGPRQYSCGQCEMSFPTSDKLKLHQLKHSDHREFLCAECGKQFKRKDKLREHAKRVHETKKKAIEINMPQDQNSKKFMPKVAPEEYHKFPFKCQDCMVGFKRRGMLVNHLAKRHPDKKIKSIPELNLPILRLTRNYPCPYCERIYKSSSKRKSHILKAHPGKPTPPQLRGTGANATVVETPGINFSGPEIRPTTTGTIVQTVTEDGDPRTGIMNVSCTSNAENNLVSTTSSNQGLRKEASVVGKVAALPHACQWCYREYATRAKLLQHQRKAHINLMPAEMQTPRTQKNNVLKTKKDKTASAAQMASGAAGSNKMLKTERHQNAITATKISDPLVPDSTSSSITPSTSTTIQTIASVNEGNVIGYLLTTAVSSGDIGNLLPSELVVLGPVSNLNSSGSGLTSQSSALAVNNANTNQNITIITPGNSSKSNNV